MIKLYVKKINNLDAVAYGFPITTEIIEVLVDDAKLESALTGDYVEIIGYRKEADHDA